MKTFGIDILAPLGAAYLTLVSASESTIRALKKDDNNNVVSLNLLLRNNLKNGTVFGLSMEFKYGASLVTMMIKLLHYSIGITTLNLVSLMIKFVSFVSFSFKIAHNSYDLSHIKSSFLYHC